MIVTEQTKTLFLTTLRQRAADRRAHTDYLESLIEDAIDCRDPRQLFKVLDDVRVPRGVTRTYAFALADDVQWIFTAGSDDTFPDAYGRLRDLAAYASERSRSRRTAVRHTVDLLPL